MFYSVVFVALVLAGAFLPVQGAVNAQLAQGLGHPLSAAVFLAIVTTVGLLIILAIVRPPIPAMARLAEIPWWMFLAGGVAGSCGPVHVCGRRTDPGRRCADCGPAGRAVSGRRGPRSLWRAGSTATQLWAGTGHRPRPAGGGCHHGAAVLEFCRSRQRTQTNLRRDCSDLKGPCLRGRAG